MSTPKFTPGPWGFWPFRKHVSIIICTGDTPLTLHGIAEIMGSGRDATAQANARLIVAAPELYDFVRIFACGSTGQDEHGEHLCVYKYEDSNNERHCREARALLAKIDGDAA